MPKNVDLKEGFQTALAGTSSFLKFRFEDMSLTLPDTGTKILNGVSGDIKPGKVTAVMGKPNKKSRTLIQPFTFKFVRSKWCWQDHVPVRHTGPSQAYIGSIIHK